MIPASKLVFFIVDMILPITIGYWIRRSNILRPEIPDYMMEIGIVIVEPILACLSFWIIPLETQLVWLLIFGTIMVFAPGIIASSIAKRKFQNPLERGGFILGAMLSNRGVIGMLTVFAIYGEIGYALVQIAMITGPLILYLYCFPLAEHYYQSFYHSKKKRDPILSIFINRRQMPMLGIALGITLNILNIDRPSVAGILFPYLVHASAWLFVIPVGYSIEFHEIKTYWKKTLDILWIKFILTPLLIFILLQIMNIGQPASQVIMILAFAPTAIYAVVTARLFKLNVHVPMTAFLLTTFVYFIFVLPLIFRWFR